MEKAFLTVNEVAEIIGLGRSKTYSLVSKGVIPSILLEGRTRRIPTSALLKWIEERGNQSNQEEAGS